MYIRECTPEDGTQLKLMFKNNIDCSAKYVDWYFENIDTRTVAAEENGRVISALELTPYDISLDSNPAKAAYISGLYTLNGYGSEDYEGALIKNALENMYSNGTDICLAVPSSYKLFDKFGFRLSYQYKQYNIAAENIPAYSMRGTAQTLQSANSDTISVLSNIYTAYTADKNGYVLRTEKIWQVILDDLLNNFGGYIALILDKEGVPVGYILYIVKGREMRIYEAAYKNHSAYSSVMAYIRSMNSNIDRISFKASADDLSYLDFCDNRTAVGLYPFATARIINVFSALTSRTAALGFSSDLSIRIVDMQLPQNNAVFDIRGGSVTRNTEDLSEADIICDIGTFTQLYTGFLSLDEAKKMNMLDGELEKANGFFSKTENYINMLIV